MLENEITIVTLELDLLIFFIKIVISALSNKKSVVPKNNNNFHKLNF